MKENEVHELLIKLRNGDEYALGTLVSIFDAQFYQRASKRYGLSYDEADEAMQRTYIKMADMIVHYNPKRAGGASWVWRIFTNTVTDMLRDRGRQRKREEPIEPGEDCAEELIGPDAYIEWLEIGEVILQTLARTPKPIIQQILAERGSRGPKCKSLKEAELYIRRIYDEVCRNQ